jgi:type I restriction-modification system DNA methylase subunit
MPAKKKTAKKPAKSFEESLWDTATKLRGSVESSEYKHVVLSLIFLKFVSDKFEERRAELIADGKDDYTDMVEFYTMQNVFYLPETSRWSYIQQHAKQGDIAIKIDSALTAVEASNASLKGTLPNQFTATTYKLAKMNLAVRGLSANLGNVAADTFFKDQHPDLKADSERDYRTPEKNFTAIAA